MPARLRTLAIGLLFAAGVAAAVVPFAGCFRGQPAPVTSDVRLVVLVVFDQMRGDYLQRWQELFEGDGFRRLQKEGAWFQDCHYPYAMTATGPGHASLLTGCSPDRHGIVGNDWFDRELGDEVYCASSPRYRPVPETETTGQAAGTKKRDKGSGAPDRLLAETFADVLKEATGGAGKVVALSLKDRSAVMPAGRKPDACYWLDKGGAFVTSTYYRDRPHAWVAEINRGHTVNDWFGKDWARLRPELDYARYSGPDDAEGESKGAKQGRVFPHPTTGGEDQPGKKYIEAMVNSPFGNDLLLDLTRRAIVAEGLGADAVPDLLSVSFSSNDIVGHTWGPDSQEVLDVTLRSDWIVRDLLAFLDERVGKGRYVLALSADHGICPTPEASQVQGRDAARVPTEGAAADAEAFLKKRFGSGEADKAQWIEASEPPWFYLNRRLIRERRLEPAAVEEALARWVEGRPGVLRGVTRTELTGDLPAGDAIGRRVQKNFHPDRCGEVYVVTQPYYLLTSYLSGTSHGTPHPYDTHVPLLVYGPGIAAGARTEPVTPQAVAAIFAQSLGIRPPASAEAPVPDGLFR